MVESQRGESPVEPVEGDPDVVDEAVEHSPAAGVLDEDNPDPPEPAEPA